MEKLLFYSNDWDDFKRLVPVIGRLEKSGFEVAVASDDQELIRALAVGKLLVVNPKTYYYSVLVSDYKTLGENMPLEEFWGVFE